MFKTSETTAKLDAALAKAQGEITPAIKDKVNPAFRSKYANYDSIIEACRPALSKYGISVTQWPLHSEDNLLHMITRLAHGGEWMTAQFSIPVDKNNAHGYGSATTYAKRFSLAAAVGISSDEDDDGNAVADNKTPQKIDPQKNAQAHAANAALTKSNKDAEERKAKFCEWARGHIEQNGFSYKNPAISRIYDHIIKPGMDGTKSADAFKAFLQNPDESIFRGMD